MSMLEAVRTCLAKYATFSGRARRSEFWWFALVTLVYNWVITFVVGFGFGVLSVASGSDRITMLAGPVALLVTLPFVIPNLAVGARRLHDIDKSGWWQLLSLVPIVGVIVLLVWWCQDSKPSNRHGPHPKGGIASAYPYQPYYPR